MYLLACRKDLSRRHVHFYSLKHLAKNIFLLEALTSGMVSQLRQSRHPLFVFVRIACEDWGLPGRRAVSASVAVGRDFCWVGDGDFFWGLIGPGSWACGRATLVSWSLG